MAGIEINASSTVCRKCGRAYGKLSGYFLPSYAYLYKGTGFMPYCRECVSKMFSAYYTECGDEEKATRQMCRKLDLYWNRDIYITASKKHGTRSVFASYVSRINNAQYSGKSYDDTLREEGTLWGEVAETKQAETDVDIDRVIESIKEAPTQIDASIDDISESTIEYWGPGYDAEMYQSLEQRRLYWQNNLPDGTTMDAGMEALIRQICNLEIDINRDRANGKAVEKQIGMLDKLINSLNQRMGQGSEGDAAFDKTPFGIWIDRWENRRPVPEPDPELKDVDHIVKYVTTWFLGHLCKMLGIKNTYCKMYEDALAEYRIENDEVEEDDDEELFNQIFSGGGDGG